MNRDFCELIHTFNDHGVEYLVAGTHALAAFGFVRATKGLDLWIRPDHENARRVLRALAAFGAPLHDLSAHDLVTPGTVFQIGVPPVRIDILTAIDGVSFEDAWQSRARHHLGETPATVISRSHFLINKKSAGRPQDLADIARLESPTTDNE